MMKMRRGFTLAEVLVTLTVVAVLATITVGVLNSTRPNQEQVMLKKAYQITGRAIEEIINDDELCPDTGEEATSGFYALGTRFCSEFVNRLNVISGDCGGDIQTIDGMKWTIPASMAGGGTITVDVNGDAKGSNCSSGSECPKGPDTFSIQVNKNGRITVPDALAKKYLQSTFTNKPYEYYLKN